MARKPAARKPTNDARTPRERQKAFLDAYSVTFSVARAAELAKIERTDHYRWMRKDAKYAKAFERRKETAGQYLETEAITRAGEGWDELVYYQGAPCGTVRRFDSGLTQFLLRGMLPSKYAVNRTEVSGPQGEPVQARIEVVFVKPEPSE
jgi:hypothetical protein